MAELLNNTTFVWGVMSMLTFLITQGLKWVFVKPYTKNLSQRKKTIINSVILLIAFAISVLCEYFYSRFWLNVPIDINRAFIGWSGASGCYAVFERILKAIKGENVVVDNPFQTEEGEATVDFVKEVVKDGKIDKKDKDVAYDFLEKLNQIK